MLEEDWLGIWQKPAASKVIRDISMARETAAPRLERRDTRFRAVLPRTGTFELCLLHRHSAGRGCEQIPAKEVRDLVAEVIVEIIAYTLK
jgi:hypothetical protein